MHEQTVDERTYLKTERSLIFKAEAYSEQQFVSSDWVLIQGLEIRISEGCLGDYSLYRTPRLAIHAFVWMPRFKVLAASEKTADFEIRVDGDSVAYWSVPLDREGLREPVQAQLLIEKPLPVANNKFLLDVRCRTASTCCLEKGMRQLLAVIYVADAVKQDDADA